MLDGRQIDPFFTGQTDCGHLGFGLVQLLFYAFSGFQSALALQMPGIANFDFVIVDPQIDEFGGLAANDDFVIASMFQFRSKKTAE